MGKVRKWPEKQGLTGVLGLKQSWIHVLSVSNLEHLIIQNLSHLKLNLLWKLKIKLFEMAGRMVFYLSLSL